MGKKYSTKENHHHKYKWKDMSNKNKRGIVLCSLDSPNEEKKKEEA